MTTVLFVPGSYEPNDYLPPIKRLRPDIEFRVWPESGEKSDITFALVHNPQPGVLKSYPNLKAIASLTAGVSHLLADPELPKVPLARMVDPIMSRDMAHYVLLHVLRYVRHMSLIEDAKKNHEWAIIPPPLRSTVVGILGVGQMGRSSAAALLEAGFEVRGWQRLPNEIAGIRVYTGRDELETFLHRTNILICLLPLTRETERLIDRELINKLPLGSFLINAGRGRHVVDRDLLEALDSGRLAGVTLDVFEDEPLSLEDPYWEHSKVTITYHSASDPDPESVALLIAENIRRSELSEPLLYEVDHEVGY